MKRARLDHNNQIQNRASEEERLEVGGINLGTTQSDILGLRCICDFCYQQVQYGGYLDHVNSCDFNPINIEKCGNCGIPKRNHNCRDFVRSLEVRIRELDNNNVELTNQMKEYEKQNSVLKEVNRRLRMINQAQLKMKNSHSDHYSLPTIVSQNEADFNERTIPTGTSTETSLDQLREKLESCPSYALFRQEIGYNAATYELVFRFYFDLIDKLEKDTNADDEMVVPYSGGNFRVFRYGQPITAKVFQQILDESEKWSKKIDGNQYECCFDNEKCKKERIRTLGMPSMISNILENHYNLEFECDCLEKRRCTTLLSFKKHCCCKKSRIVKPDDALLVNLNQVNRYKKGAFIIYQNGEIMTKDQFEELLEKVDENLIKKFVEENPGLEYLGEPSKWQRRRYVQSHVISQQLYVTFACLCGQQFFDFVKYAVHYHHNGKCRFEALKNRIRSQ